MKKILLSLLISLIAIPASAKHYTQPNDRVGVYFTIMDGPIVKKEIYYFKPWKMLKLDKKTRATIHFELSKVKAKDRDEKFRVGFIRVVNDEVQSAIYYGDKGSAVVVNFGLNQNCHITIGGNGLPGGCDLVN